MIKYCCKNGEISLEANGNLNTLEADILLLVSKIYSGLDGKDAKDLFKDSIKKAFEEDLPFLTIEEIDKKTEEIKPVEDKKDKDTVPQDDEDDGKDSKEKDRDFVDEFVDFLAKKIFGGKR